MLQNAYLLAKFGFDTAENEICKICPIEQCSAADAIAFGLAACAMPWTFRSGFRREFSTAELCAEATFRDPPSLFTIRNAYSYEIKGTEPPLF